MEYRYPSHQCCNSYRYAMPVLYHTAVHVYVLSTMVPLVLEYYHVVLEYHGMGFGSIAIWWVKGGQCSVIACTIRVISIEQYCHTLVLRHHAKLWPVR
jgi:hypothetical protein